MPPLWITGLLRLLLRRHADRGLCAGDRAHPLPRHGVGAALPGGNQRRAPLALALEGHLYDHFHAHGPAIQWLLATIPITLIAILFLPEPAGKTLEEMSGG